MIKIRTVLLAVVASFVAALTVASPAIAGPPHTAGPCVFTSGQCLYSGANASGHLGYDARGANNAALNQWAFNGTTVEIATNLSSTTFAATPCSIRYYTGASYSGSYITAPGDPNVASLLNFKNSFDNNVFSFQWFC